MADMNSRFGVSETQNFGIEDKAIPENTKKAAKFPL